MVSSLNFPPKMMMCVGREAAALLLSSCPVGFSIPYLSSASSQGKVNPNDDGQIIALTKETKGPLAGYDLDISVDSVNDESCLQASSPVDPSPGVS